MKKMGLFICLTMMLIINVFAQTEPLDTDGDGYRNVSTLDHLKWISQNSIGWSYNYELDNNINAAATKNWNDTLGFSAIGNSTTKFAGKFNGNGYYIDSLFINRSTQSYIGFFGYTNAAEIKNLGLTNVDLKGSGYVGGLIGYNYSNSNISNCYSTGRVTGSSNYVGGLVGSNSSSIISNCYSTSNVIGSSSTGGLVGSNNTSSSISYCYSNGSVTGSSSVGGMVGSNSSSTVSYSLWDIESSGKTNSAGGTGIATAEMKTKSTYTDLRWNFLAIWMLDPLQNNGYPYIYDRSIELTIGIEPTDTDGDGYRNISIFAHLVWVSNNSSSWALNYELDNDINASPTNYWNTLLGFSPIGNSTKKYTGKFNANGFKIDSLYINRQSQNFIGFFGYTAGAQIINLGLTNVNIMGSGNVGGLVGYNSSSISYSYSNGIVIGSGNVGGLVGYNSSSNINNCYSISSVKGSDENVGGLIGSNSGPIGSNNGTYNINNCYSNGSVNSSSSNVGGLVGRNNESTSISNCYSTSSITGSGNIGGLVGSNSGKFILHSYSTGSVIGNAENVGGFIGSNIGIISNCYSTGSVIGNAENVGGFFGYNQSENISNCYSTGSVIGNANNVGGFIGLSALDESIVKVIKSCFWDTESSGKTTSAGGIGRTTAQMKTKSTFANIGWNFDFIWVIEDNYPYIAIDSSYRPIDSDGNGYLNISTLTDLRWLSESGLDLNKSWELDNNINAKETIFWNDSLGFLPIGNYVNFTGKFNGNGYIIDSLFINRPNLGSVGFFSNAHSNAKITNLGLTNVNIQGGWSVGGLIGMTYSNSQSINNCYSIGSVKGRVYVGGLIGNNESYNSISNCFSSGSVMGESYVGGLVGYNRSYNIFSSYGIINSYSTSSVIGGDYTGGLVGSNSSTSSISNCYSNGSVTSSIVSNSYYDIKEGLGGLVGQNNGPISNCFSSSSVTASNSNSTNVGGLVGGTYSSTISNSYSTGTVTGGSNVGGLVGSNNSSSSINNCYSIGSVAGYYSGGLVGNNSSSSIKNSYSSGSVTGSTSGGLVGYSTNATVSNCYWDKLTSGKTTSNGGTPKTTLEMKTKSTFVNWEFDSTWAISSELNEGYPYLQSFITLSIPVLVNPKNGVTNQELSLNLYWNSVIGATSYVIQLSTLNTFSTTLINENTSRTDKVVSNLVRNTTYYWRVKAVNSAGESDWSMVWSFTTKNTNNFEITFKQGWNLVSSYISPDLPDSLQYVTADLNPNLVIMKRADGKIFMPGGLNQIGKWDVKFGYQAYLTKADTLGIIGTAVNPENTPVHLNNGWSIIPYLRNSPMSIVTALASITDAGRLVIVKRADGKIFMPGGLNQIGNQLPGEGYQAYLNAKDTLIYPPNSAGRTTSSNHIDDFDARIIKTDYENTGNNSSLILDIDLTDNTELAVMNSDNKIVGAGRVVDGNTAIVIWGDDELTNAIDGSVENYELRIMNYDAENGKYIEINNLDLTDIITGTKYNKLTYNKDAVLIGKALTQSISLKVNPNPFSNSTEVIYKLADDCEIELSLYNLSGMKVLDIAHGKQTKGTHKLTINAENLSSGTYNVILKSCGKSVSERVVIIK